MLLYYGGTNILYNIRVYQHPEHTSFDPTNYDNTQQLNLLCVIIIQSIA